MPPFTSLPVVTAPSIAIFNSQMRFALRRVYCVGRNYAEHAREMGHDPHKEPPFFFSKPTDAIVPASGHIAYPPLTDNLHYEVELVVALGKDGRNIPASEALEHVWGYAAGVDLTRRDLQARAKQAGHPWDDAKGFDESGPCTALVPVSTCGHPGRSRIWLDVNGVRQQDGNLADMIWAVPDIIAALSQSVVLKAGDLIFTGTPAGVGPVAPGDTITGGVEGIAEFSFAIAAAKGHLRT